MSAHRDLIRGDGQLRIATWRGDTTTAYLTPASGRPTAASVQRVIGELRAAGYRRAFTSALGATDSMPFIEAGFEVHERLHLLIRPVTPTLRPSGRVPIRRGRRADRDNILAVDTAAFPPFWRLDDPALDDALAATPSSRLRVVDRSGGDDTLAAYAVTGRAGSRGYLQRLAVDPSLHRSGLGSALVTDAIHWLRRWGAREVLVNTQEHNQAALGLYEAMGFQRQVDGLSVLQHVVAEAVD